VVGTINQLAQDFDVAASSCAAVNLEVLLIPNE